MEEKSEDKRTRRNSETKKMRQLESRVQRECIEYLNMLGYYVIKLIQTNKNGIADVLAFKRKKKGHGVENIFFVEVKRKGEIPDPLQQYRHTEIALHGIMTYVIDDSAILKEMVTK